MSSHQISKTIVEEAKRTNAVIVAGKLKGIRQRVKGGRRTKRLVNNFPYYRLVQYIKYKAEWAGILVFEIPEGYTSVTCSNCRARGVRPTQGLFRCKRCGETNADYNGAMSILHRGFGILSSLGGFLTYPACDVKPQELPVIVERNKMTTGEYIPSYMKEPPLALARRGCQ